MTAPTPADDPTAAPPESGLTAAQMASLLALVEAQAALRQQIVDAAIKAVVAPIRAAGADVWWNDAAFRKAISAAVKIVQPSQKTAARQTDAYTARALKVMSGRNVRPAGAVDVSKLRKALPADVARELVDGNREPGFVVLGDTHDGPGEHIDEYLKIVNDAREYLDPEDPYLRIAESYRYAVVAKGVPEPDAREDALLRLAVATETDVTLAVRAQYAKTLADTKGVVGYRRILHPELSKSGPCGLCVVAADRTYRVSDLKPIHGRCVCEVLPILERAGNRLDPGISLNWDDLQKLYQAAGRALDPDNPDATSTSGKGLKKVRVALTENAEIGPVLVNADHKYRGPRQVAETKVADKATRLRHQYEVLLDTHAKTREKAEAGNKISQGALKWQTARIAELERELSRL